MLKGGSHIPPQITEDVVSTITWLKKRAGFPVGISLDIIDLSRATYFRWSKAGSKKKHEVSKDHWLQDWETGCIIAYKREHPEIGYHRLSWMMVDAGIVAVSPTSVHRVLLHAGLANHRTTHPGVPAANREEFVQPRRPYEQWHREIIYINIFGANYFFISIQDGYSRYIVHHELKTDMTTRDMETVTEYALKKLPAKCDAPRLITDRSQYLSREFESYLKECDISQSKAGVNHPQSKGNIENFHKSLKEKFIQVTAMTELEEARRLMYGLVTDYNENCLLSTLQYLAPVDYLKGDEHIRQRLERRKEKLKEAAGIRRASRKPEMDLA